MTNLMELMGDSVHPTGQSRKLTIGGHTDIYYVYEVKLDLLYYNDKNDRIATWINQYETEHGPLDLNDRETYNDIIQEFIELSNPEAMTATKNNIAAIGQQEPGVVLPDGRIIDGNRRFTCLRKLRDEGKQSEYFETMILSDDYNPTDKRIKTLELNIQLGKEKPVDYDPVDRMYAVYRDVVQNKMFNKKEYAEATNMSPSAVDMLIEKSKLMVEFLEYAGADGQFYLARELKLDGPLQEAVGVLKKCGSEEEKERMKIVIFSNILAAPKSDMTRHIRQFKKIADSEELDSFLDEQEDVAVRILDKIETSDESNVIDKIKELRADDDICSDIGRNATETIVRIDKTTAKNIPLNNANKAFELLSDIDLVMVRMMAEDSRGDLRRTISDLEELLKELRDAVQ